jgi:chromosome segregation ATPase
MFSYGEDNTINFDKIGGLMGLFAPNAAGKSSLFDAISFCLFDKCSRAFKAGNILNNRKDTFSCKLEIEIDGKVTVENFAACDPYQLMADSMSRRIRGGDGWLMPHSDSIAFAEVFDQAFEVMGRP